MNSNKGKQKFFVIYQITNLLDNRIYVGLHCTFNISDKYMGSSKHLKKDLKELGRQNFKKEILHIFDNKEDMIKMEAEIVDRKFCHRPDTYNRMIGGQNYNNLGMIPVKDKENNFLSVYNDDPRYLSGELVGVRKNVEGEKDKFAAKDKDGNIFQIHRNDIRYLSGELVGHNKGNNINQKWLGKNHTKETKEKIGLANSRIQKGEGNSQYGTCWITKDGINKKITKHQLNDYINQGWVKGRKI